MCLEREHERMAKKTPNQHVIIKLICVISLVGAMAARSKDVFVAQSATGIADGSSSANPNSLDWLNNATWGNGSAIQPGDIVHLGGTFSSALAIRGSGTAGNPITILFDSGAKFSAPTWPQDSYIISGTASYITIDGGVNGIIEATDNGYGLTFSNSFSAIDLHPGSSVEIKNLSIVNLFPRTSNSVDCTHAPTAIRCGNSGMQDLLIHNNSITNVGNGIIVYPQTGVSTNIQVYSNSVFQCSWGIYCEATGGGTYFYNTKIWANRINNGTGWDGCPGPFHQDAIIAGVPYVSGDVLKSTNYNMEIFGNDIGPDCGYSSTSAIYLESTWDNKCNDRPKIYNNLIRISSGQKWNSGTIAWNAKSAKVFNNTLVGSGAAGLAFQMDGDGASVMNNLVVNFGVFYHNPQNAPAGYTNVDMLNSADYNVGANVSQWWAPGSFTWGGSTDYRDHATYPQFSTFDNHSSNLTPRLNASYQPFSTDTVLPGRGTNLSADCTTDFSGNLRPATARWTIGAFEVSSTLSSMQPPTVNPPVRVTP
jgi:hypothetical protein